MSESDFAEAAGADADASAADASEAAAPEADAPAAEAVADAPDADAAGEIDIAADPEFDVNPDEFYVSWEDDGPSVDDVVGALVTALKSGNAGDAENALALVAEAGFDVSGSPIPMQKRELAPAGEEAEAEAEAEADADADEAEGLA